LTKIKYWLTLINKKVIERFGGGPHGIRYDSDLERIDTFQQAVPILLKDHPFTNGNKRTAYVAFRLHYLGHQLPLSEAPDPEHMVHVLPQKIDYILKENKEWLEALAEI